MSTIEVKNVSRTYTQGDLEVHALRNATLTFTDGEFGALAGPSGSGKTTLLNMIGCLDQPTSGNVIVNGTDVTNLSRTEGAKFRLANIGFVFQAYNLIPVLSAYENAEFIMMLQGVAAAERKARVTQLMKRVGLTNEMHRRPHELSGGQQQRVAVVRAIAAKPSIVLADEPTANLYSKTSAALLDMMLELNEEDGVTFLFSTHDPMVMERAKRLIRLDSGLIVEAGQEAA